MWCDKSRLIPGQWGDLARTFGGIIKGHPFPDDFPDHDFNRWMETFQFRFGTAGRSMLAELYIKWLHFEGLHLMFEDEAIGNHVTVECWEAWKEHEDETTAGFHPCDDWRALECVCKGSCSCHWKVEPGDEDDTVI